MTAAPAAAGTTSGPTTAAVPSLPASEMTRIQKYLDDRYQQKDVRHSFRTKFGETVDCIDYFAHPSIRELVADGTQVTLPPRAPRKQRTGMAAEIAFDGAIDDQGQARECPDGTVPMLQRTAAEIASYGGLDAYRDAHSGKHHVRPPLGSSGPGAGTPPPAASVCNTPFGYDVPNYAHVQGTFSASKITKGYSSLSIWTPSPAVPNNTSDPHYISQVWLYAGWGFNGFGCTCTMNPRSTTTPPCTQSVEVGAEVAPYEYPSAPNSPHLVVFTTRDGYSTGCFNGETGCGVKWVPANSSPFAVGQALNSSFVGYPSQELTFQIAQTTIGSTAVWGVYVSGELLGGFVRANFAQTPYVMPMATSGGQYFQTGGETYDGTGTNSVPMGSVGYNPQAGFGYSPYAAESGICTANGSCSMTLNNGPAGGYGPVTVPDVFSWADYKTTGPSTIEPWPDNYFYFGNVYSTSHTCGILGKAGETLTMGSTLYQGWSDWSCDGRFQLTLQTDGNLVLYQWDNNGNETPLWWTGTYHAGAVGAIAVMQADGNFVVYDNMGVPLWWSGTDSDPGSYLDVEDDGVVVILAPDGTDVWDSNTCCH